MFETAGWKIRDIFQGISELFYRCSDTLKLTPDELQRRGHGISDVLRVLDRGINRLSKKEFPSTKARVAKMLQQSRNLTWTVGWVSEIHRQALDLKELFEFEIKSKTFLMLTGTEKEQYECNEPVFGQKVNDRFPEAVHHLTEASKCYALERYAAGIYHLMCALQAPLNALAQKVHVKQSATWETWGTVIREIRLAIEGLPHSTRKEQAKRERYNQILQPLLAFKVAHRDPTMHARAHYSPDEARHIWNSVESFFHRVAEDLPKRKVR